MSGKQVSIDFGTVFPSGIHDRDKLVRCIKNSVQVNGLAILENGAYKAKVEGNERPMRLKVTVELTEA